MKASLKKNILIWVASSAGFLLLTALGLYVYFMLQFNVYQDDQYKFSIKYPKTWKVFIHPKKDVAVIFQRPKDTAFDPFFENFCVVVQPVPDDILTVQAYTATIKKQMLAVFKGNISVVEDKSIQWGWREGHIWSIVAPNPDHLRMDNAWVLRGSQAYLMAYLSDMNKYSQDALYVEEMFRSLQLL